MNNVLNKHLISVPVLKCFRDIDRQLGFIDMEHFFIHGSTFYQKTAKNYKNSSDKENLHFNQTSIPISTVNKISGIRNTEHSNYPTNRQRFLYESINANELYQITPNLGLTHIIKVLKSYM